MKLTDLEATFIRVVEPGHLYQDVETFAEAQGIRFLCPLCFRENGGRVGTHSVVVWFKDRGVLPIERPTPRWSVQGTSLENLTVRPSIHIRSCWHGFVTNGEASII